MSRGCTKKELAEISGYTYRRLYDIDRDLPKDKKLFVESEGGKCDLAVFVQRWVEYNVSRETENSSDLDAVKAKHEIVKTQKTELEVARMRGQLIDVADVKRLWGDIASTVTQNLLHVASKAAPLVRMMDSVEAIQGIIDGEIRSALEHIAETPLPDYAAEEEKESDESGEDDGEV